jgi:hypothetical protein
MATQQYVNAFGEEYGFAQVKAFLFGGLQELVGFSSLKYSHKQDISAISGAGNKNVAWMAGAETLDASVKISFKELHAALIAQGVNYAKLSSIPAFDIVVILGDGVELPKIKHTLKSCKFIETKFEWTGGMTDNSQEIGLFIMDILIEEI